MCTPIQTNKSYIPGISGKKKQKTCIQLPNVFFSLRWLRLMRKPELLPDASMCDATCRSSTIRFHQREGGWQSWISWMGKWFFSYVLGGKKHINNVRAWFTIMVVHLGLKDFKMVWKRHFQKLQHWICCILNSAVSKYGWVLQLANYTQHFSDFSSLTVQKRDVFGGFSTAWFQPSLAATVALGRSRQLKRRSVLGSRNERKWGARMAS